MVRYCKFLTGHLWGKIYRRTLKEVLIGYKPMGEGLVLLSQKISWPGGGSPATWRKEKMVWDFQG